jgi:hypothetical protein
MSSQSSGKLRVLESALCCVVVPFRLLRVTELDVLPLQKQTRPHLPICTSIKVQVFISAHMVSELPKHSENELHFHEDSDTSAESLKSLSRVTKASL